jgi:signal peptidase II
MSLMRQRAIKPTTSEEKLSPQAQVRWDLIVAAIAVLVIVLDQISKTLVVDHFHTCYSNASVPIIGDILTLQYVCNQGTAFSFFYGSKVVYFLIAVAAGVIVWLYVSTRSRANPWLKVTFGMIIGGAIGNIIDRVILGYVRDFIYFQLPAFNFHFDIFNVADSSIVVGMIALALIFWTLPREQESDVADETPSGNVVVTGTTPDAEGDNAPARNESIAATEQPMIVADPATSVTMTASDVPPTPVSATSMPERPARATTPVARVNAPVSVPRAAATSLPRSSKYPNTVKSKRKKK